MFSCSCVYKYTSVLFLFSRFAKRTVFCTIWLSVVRGVDKQQQQQKKKKKKKKKKKTVVVEIRLFSHDILSESDGTKRIRAGSAGGEARWNRRKRWVLLSASC